MKIPETISEEGNLVKGVTMKTPLITDYYGDMGEVLSAKIEGEDYILNSLLRESAAERKREIDQKLGAITKTSPLRPGLVQESYSLSRLLRVVNSAVKRKNVSGIGYDSGPSVRVDHSISNDPDAPTSMDVWAGIAMHALIVTSKGDMSKAEIAAEAWLLAEMMDEAAP